MLRFKDIPLDEAEKLLVDTGVLYALNRLIFDAVTLKKLEQAFAEAVKVRGGT